jgi:hypothetical protein
MNLATIARDFPQFGRSSWSVSRHRSYVFGGRLNRGAGDSVGEPKGCCGEYLTGSEQCSPDACGCGTGYGESRSCHGGRACRGVSRTCGERPSIEAGGASVSQDELRPNLANLRQPRGLMQRTKARDVVGGEGGVGTAPTLVTDEDPIYVCGAPIEALWWWLLIPLIFTGGCSKPRDCCAEAEAAGLNRTSAGGVVCCDGIKYSCSWGPGGPYTNPDAIGIVRACVVEHENDHHDDVDCPAGPGPTRPPFRPGSDPAAEERKAYAVEAACLRRARARCGGSPACERDVDSRLAFVMRMGR